MFSKERLKSLLSGIMDSITLIESQKNAIKSPMDFVSTQQGVFVMGEICMQLVLIGETIKVIDTKTEGTYLCKKVKKYFVDKEKVAIFALAIQK